MKIPNVLWLALSLTFILPFAGCSKSGQIEGTNGQEAGPAARAEAKPGAVELKLNWPVGQRLVHQLELDQEMTINLPQGIPMKQGMKQVQEYAVTVLGEPVPGGRELELEYLAFRGEMNMAGQSLSFDTNDATDATGNPLAGLMREMTGARIKLVISPDQQIERTEGVKELTSNLAGSGEMGELLSGMVSEDSLRTMLLDYGLPDHPVAPGDSWPVQMEINQGPLGVIVLDSQYQFEAWEEREGRKCARLIFSGSVRGKPGSAPQSGGMEFKIQNGQTFGTIWFDPDPGLVIESNADQEMKMQMSGPGMPGNEPIPMQVAQKITLKVIEIGDAPAN